MRSDPSRYPTPNTVCYNAALMALMRKGRWKEARKLLTEVSSTSTETRFPGGEEASREGMDRPGEGVLDFLSFNTVIRACAAAGEVEEVSGVVRKCFGGGMDRWTMERERDYVAERLVFPPRVRDRVSCCCGAGRVALCATKA